MGGSHTEIYSSCPGEVVHKVCNSAGRYINTKSGYLVGSNHLLSIVAELGGDIIHIVCAAQLSLSQLPTTIQHIVCHVGPARREKEVWDRTASSIVEGWAAQERHAAPFSSSCLCHESRLLVYRS